MLPKKWSQTHTESRPAASAYSANARMSGHEGVRPAPSEDDMGTMTPTRTRAV